MTEKRQSTCKYTILHKILIAVLLIGVFIPAIICSLLAYEVHLMKNEMADLQSEITVMSGKLNGQQMNQSQSEIGEDGLFSEKLDVEDSMDLIANVEQIENEIVWESIEQDGNAWSSDSDIRRVYLTFDDGPSSNTDRILDILNEYGVKATFFVVGKEGFTEEYQRIVQEGHTLGMHSFSHKYQEIYKSVEAYQEDLDKLHSFLYETTGVDCDIVRFPGGSSNKTSKVDMQDVITYLTEQGMTYFDWNVSSGDAASNYVSANQIANNVLNNVWKFDSVIVLMHDSSAKSTTVEALPVIIEKILESDNTVLLPISEDTIPIQHIKQNVNKGGKLEES